MPDAPLAAPALPSLPLRAHALRFDAFGGPEVLHLAEMPYGEPDFREALVAVQAASVNPSDVKNVAGRMRQTVPPRTPGRDYAGVVVAGPAEWLGAEVWGTGGDQGYLRDGSHARYLRVPLEALRRKPANLSFEQAAAVPISGLTAIQAVRKAKVQAGQSVAVLGASGGVGSYVVQIAKAAGAEVTGVSSTAKVDLVGGLGADHVVDYTQRDYAEDGPYDVILDIGGSRTLGELRRALTPKGRLIIVGGETDGRWLGGFDRQFRAGLLSPFVGQTLGQVASLEKAEDLVALTELIEAGQVTPAVERTYPLAEAAAAMAHLIAGQARGKLVLHI